MKKMKGMKILGRHLFNSTLLLTFLRVLYENHGLTGIHIF